MFSNEKIYFSQIDTGAVRRQLDSLTFRIRIQTGAKSGSESELPVYSVHTVLYSSGYDLFIQCFLMFGHLTGILLK